ncbi:MULTISPECIES: DUF732 domain-containing protein [unclassified Gordonia (in: high G+C Gram-positive bacteria)]|uniref:DUF732 domain-containing protein n=1 Tax=unclassified Gordonia (in: high G+C Gram-positive bacteria) TaxID=2657482 RepID=UPI001FFEBFCC|nr:MULTISPECIES: DUF732 domain-containing protein [unclassified Gordonia (in: high G+C Gram-positive bacteria)]UQE74337.1 DUF732 domain-containing protein [Gordonia sp. PP30]
MRSTAYRLLLLPAAAAAVLTLGACGNDSDGVHSDSTHDNAYITALKAAGVDVSDRDARISEGKQVCKDLKDGKQVISYDGSAGADTAQKAALAGAAVGAFCPDMQSKLMPTGLPTG